MIEHQPDTLQLSAEQIQAEVEKLPLNQQIIRHHLKASIFSKVYPLEELEEPFYGIQSGPALDRNFYINVVNAAIDSAIIGAYLLDGKKFGSQLLAYCRNINIDLEAYSELKNKRNLGHLSNKRLLETICQAFNQKYIGQIGLPVTPGEINSTDYQAVDFKALLDKAIIKE